MPKTMLDNQNDATHLLDASSECTLPQQLGNTAGNDSQASRQSMSKASSAPSPNPTSTSVLGRITASPAHLRASIRARFRTLNQDEKPKKVSNDSRGSAVLHFVLFHLPAIAITITLLAIHACRIVWQNPHPTNNELNALLFASKAHESLILMSLADILLHRLQYGLLGDDGVALGFLTSVYQLGMPVQYLTSWEFWAAFINPSRNRRFHSMTGATIILVTLLALGSSPFSAIVMIPRQGWWELPDRSMQGYYLAENPYHYKLDSKNAIPMELCPASSEDINDETPACIGRDGTEMLGQFKSLMKGLSTGEDLFKNTTFSISPDTGGGGVFRGQLKPPTSVWSGGDELSTTYALSPMRFLGGVLATPGVAFSYIHDRVLVILEKIGLDEGKRFKHPLVAAACAESDSDFSFEPISSTTFEFWNHVFQRATVKIGNGTMYVPQGGSNASELLPIFPDIEEIRNQIPSPVSTAIMFPRVVPDGYPFQNKTKNTLVLCLAQARWLEADAWRTGYPESDIQLGTDFAAMLAYQYMNMSTWDDGIIDINNGWLRSVGIKDHGSASGFLNPTYKEVMPYCHNYTTPSWCYQNLLTASLADLLAYTSPPIYYSLDPRNTYQDPPPTAQDIILKPRYYKYAYAYAFQNSITLIMAFVVLLLHACLALSHMAVIVCSRDPWRGLSWSSFGQMLALALQSPEGLTNVGGGVASSQTWKKVVAVRKAQDSGKLHMVIEEKERQASRDMEDVEMRHIRAGERYS